MRRPLVTFLISVVLITGLAAQNPAAGTGLSLPNEPAPNLGRLKSDLVEYHNCLNKNCYGPEIGRQSDIAIRYLRHRVARSTADVKFAMVLDIDETALSNWSEELHNDFGYIQADWDAWINSEKAPAISGTLRVYREAQELGVAVFFITGRPEAQKNVTIQNLETVGFTNWSGLAMRGPHPDGQTLVGYKSGERQKLVDAGYHIVVNIGDQLSDLTGKPQADLSVKLPNPFYYIP